MNTKHTPGPWNVSPSAKASTLTRVFDETGKLVASANGPGLFEGGEAEANARLIAAAPDLLAALVKLEDFMRWAQDNADTRGFLDAVDHANVTQAQQAIAKATNSL